ncbi:MAG: transketolase [Spirochaetales bacterium]|nr:transketolase [Spirochaetales bacterium]
MDTNTIKKTATTIRSLSMDGVQAANSGHPGLPMGCAELGAVLYGSILNINPKNPAWINRDRFVLSAGHGSMFLYSLLFLSGFDVRLDELKNFRQLHSRTAGHPEYGLIPGIETTTGPLGAGFSNAVGMAIAETMLAAKFNTKDQKIIDHYTYALSGDGCMMEGITSEAASLAGHLKLGKLIVFYDSNHITIEGSTDLAFTEDVRARFEAYGWQTLEGNAQNGQEIIKLVEQAKAETGKPTLIKLNSIIGFGSPNKAGTHDVHGAPLGEEEVKATRLNLGLKEDEAFYVAPEATAYFTEKRKSWEELNNSWNDAFSAWAKANPEKKKEWDDFFSDVSAKAAKIEFPAYNTGDKVATRNASGKALVKAADALENLIGGSADLSPSNKTDMPGKGEYQADSRSGRTFHFGVREHGMGGIVNGMALHSGFRAFCATFLVFSDYMRPAVRLAAIMKLPVIYVFSHDSIYVGEDGPTHQPIEHVMALRLIPNVWVMRPADAEETNEAWRLALERNDGPVALATTRQNLTVFAKPAGWKEQFKKGAYIVREAKGTPQAVIVATGSEVNMALEAAEKSGRNVRVVSMPCRELFSKQTSSYRELILPQDIKTIVAEAGVPLGWGGVASSEEHIVAINRFGESGPAGKVAEYLGLTSDAIAAALDR